MTLFSFMFQPSRCDVMSTRNVIPWHRNITIDTFKALQEHCIQMPRTSQTMDYQLLKNFHKTDSGLLLAEHGYLGMSVINIVHCIVLAHSIHVLFQDSFNILLTKKKYVHYLPLMRQPFWALSIFLIVFKNMYWMSKRLFPTVQIFILKKNVLEKLIYTSPLRLCSEYIN